MTYLLLAPNFMDGVGVMPETFAEWVSKELKRTGLTAGQLAKKAKVTRATMSRILSSDIGSTRDTVLKIADALESSRMEAIIYWLADETQHGGAVYPASPEGGRVNLPDGGWYIPREGEDPTWRRLIAETVASIELIKQGSGISVSRGRTHEKYESVPGEE